MGEFCQYLGIRWTPTARISDVENLDADRTVQISFRQWVLLLTLIRLGSEGSSEAKSAIDLASVLQGFSWAQLAQDGMSSLGQAEVGLKKPSLIGRRSLGPNAPEISLEKPHSDDPDRSGCEHHPDRIFHKARSCYPSFVVGESEDSVAAGPRNDATPDTSVKGVRDDA